MNKPFTANTQHNDFTGTVALDCRFECSTALKELAALCNVPPNFYPVGFYLSGVRHTDGLADFYLAAAESEAALTEYIQNPHPLKKLFVTRFAGKLNLADLPKYFKMLSIAATLKVLKDRKIEYDPSKDVEGTEDAE